MDHDHVFPLFNPEKDIVRDLPPHRPALSSRQSSYSKRYASFDSHCEVPLPSYLKSSPPSKIATTSPPYSYSFPTAVKGHRVDIPSPGSSHLVSATVSAYKHELDSNGATFYSTSSSLARSTSPSFSSSDLMDSIQPSLPTYTAASTSPTKLGGPRHTRDSSNGSIPQKSLASPPISQSQSSSPSPSMAGFVFPFSRPHSLPDAYTQEHPLSSPPLRPTWPERNSAASLPLPMQTPYSTLPKVANGSIVDEEKEWLQFGSGAQQDVLRPAPPLDQQAPKDAMFSSNAHPASSSSSPTSLRLRAPIPAMAPPSPGSRSLSASAISVGGVYPPPAPPTILTPPPRSEGAAAAAPYEPFLNHAPPPVDSWIAVETTQPEYRLIVRLPGFHRDGITLATRRRRVLHLVADSWEPGGGHFERRISFGYDADLNQVRAEFDGELLRVIIPRRLHPLNTWYQTPATTA